MTTNIETITFQWNLHLQSICQCKLLLKLGPKLGLTGSRLRFGGPRLVFVGLMLGLEYQDYSNSNLTLTYWASWIPDSSLVWDIYILENSNLGPNIDCNWHWQVDLRHLYLLKIKLPQCLWSWNGPQFSSSIRSTYLRNIHG